MLYRAPDAVCKRNRGVSRIAWLCLDRGAGLSELPLLEHLSVCIDHFSHQNCQCRRRFYHADSADSFRRTSERGSHTSGCYSCGEPINHPAAIRMRVHRKTYALFECKAWLGRLKFGHIHVRQLMPAIPNSHRDRAYRHNARSVVRAGLWPGLHFDIGKNNNDHARRSIAPESRRTAPRNGHTSCLVQSCSTIWV